MTPTQAGCQRYLMSLHKAVSAKNNEKVCRLGRDMWVGMGSAVSILVGEVGQVRTDKGTPKANSSGNL